MAKPLTPPNSATVVAALSTGARLLLAHTRAEAERRGVPLWAVGGTVRDAVTGRAAVDLDLAVDGSTETLATTVAGTAGGVATSEPRFGTASVLVGADRLDLAALRDERYEAPGVLPTVSVGASIEDDLARRDFSVNAMALGLAGPRAGEFVDPFGGLVDLTSRRYRILHDRSFEDDATRIWRAARLGVHHDLRPTAPTRDRLIAGARWLNVVSGDRLWSEFALIAERGRAGRTLGLLDDWSALAGTSAALALTAESREALRHRWHPLPVGRLAAVLLATRESTAAGVALMRLNAPASAARAVRDARALLTTADAAADQLEVLAGTTEDARDAARCLDPRQVPLQRALRRWERTRPHLTATELLELGVSVGPSVGAWLACLRRRRYLGTLGTAAEARALVRRHLDAGEGS